MVKKAANRALVAAIGPTKSLKQEKITTKSNPDRSQDKA